MAHECPVCGLLCHCNGDIGDCCFDSEFTETCKHCDEEINFDSDDDYFLPDKQEAGK